MTERRVTSLDVAALAGVSQSAVSRVFTPGASVSSKMEERVRRAADALGYRPNVLARSLITGRSRIIGLVVGYLENQFYPDALERLSTALQEKGYHILVFMTEGSQADGGEVIQDLLDYQVDGLVTASVGMSDDLATRCEAAGIPVVLFNRGQDDPRLSEVTSDNRAGAQEVARFLAAGGHRRIAHISGWLGSSTGQERAMGFREALDGLGVPQIAEETGSFSRSGAEDAARILMREAKPDAIFVGNDHMAFAVMDVLRFELGLDVPGDVSVVGYDDVSLAGWPAYDLTTVRQPSGAMVEATVDLLMDRLEGRVTVPQKRRIEGTLQLRGSARVPEGWGGKDRL